MVKATAYKLGKAIFKEVDRIDGDRYYEEDDGEGEFFLSEKCLLNYGATPLPEEECDTPKCPYCDNYHEPSGWKCHTPKPEDEEILPLDDVSWRNATESENIEELFTTVNELVRAYNKLNKEK